MNSLSWMIYFADLSHGIAGLIITLTTTGLFVVMAQSTVNKKLTVMPIIKLIPFLWILGVILPSKDTVYAIAASELGEKVVASQLSTKAQKAIDAWLDRQISGDKKP